MHQDTKFDLEKYLRKIGHERSKEYLCDLTRVVLNEVYGYNYDVKVSFSQNSLCFYATLSDKNGKMRHEVAVSREFLCQFPEAEPFELIPRLVKAFNEKLHTQSFSWEGTKGQYCFEVLSGEHRRKII